VGSRIRTLSENVSNMIAAGEVVEAPFSVVKELVENALDANASEIAVDIKGGGSDLVRVSDNGSGMNKDDALAAFDRFATSKLSDAADLDNIGTLGFRGEALPSIASVSRVRLVTCEDGDVEGTEVDLVGGEIRNVRPAGRAPGTTVEVSSLFYNTPARRKFLKSDRVEIRRMMDLLTEYAVLNPSIRFDVAIDGRLAMGLMAADGIAERVAGVLGSGMSAEMLPVSHSDDGGSVEGLVGRPTIARPRGAQQVIAINGRPIRSRLISAAVRSGYGELLPSNRHPVLFLLINVDGSQVDVNVHPTKREVRFGDSRKIFGLVESAVRAALMSHDTAPTLSTYDAGLGARGDAAAGAGPTGAGLAGATGAGAAAGAEVATQELQFPSVMRETHAADVPADELRAARRTRITPSSGSCTSRTSSFRRGRASSSSTSTRRTSACSTRRRGSRCRAPRRPAPASSCSSRSPSSSRRASGSPSTTSNRSSPSWASRSER
jgi:DNA mismatch repair protein MutL